MPSIRKTSAIIVLDICPDVIFSIHMLSGGNPENIRKAFRRACSRRRSIVLERPNHYVANVIASCSRLGHDICELIETPLIRDLRIGFHYVLTIDFEKPVISIQEGANRPQIMPFFKFLGAEWTLKNPSLSRNRKRLGRPTRLTAAIKRQKAKSQDNTLDPSEDPANFLPVGERPAWLQEIIDKDKATQPDKRKPRKIVKD